MNFESLVGRINLIQDALQAQAAHAVNLSLPTAKLQLDDCLNDGKLRLSTAKSTKEEWQTPSDRLFYKLSATHLVLLANLKDPLKRAFYEQEI